MRIVFIVHRYWPSVGGVEKYVHELSVALRELGHDPLVVAAAHADRLPARGEHEGIPVLRFPATRSGIRCRWWFRRNRDLFRRADAVSVSNTHVWEYAEPWLDGLVDRRRIYLIRHGMGMKYPVPEEHRRRAARGQEGVAGVAHDGRFIERWLDVAADICPEQGLRPLADEIAHPAPGEPNSAIYVGRLELDTGIQTYLDAVAKLDPQRTGQFRLDVCGDGSLRENLEARVRRERLSVRFLGRIPDAQQLLGRHAFAFVDGRMVIQEAMARRRPVLSAYGHPLKRDYLCGESFSPFLFAASSGTDLANRVRKLAEDPRDMRETVERAFEFSRRLSWTETARRYLALWHGEKGPNCPRSTPTAHGAEMAPAL
ncbi:MAG: glycosyltransferase family 4 protein [Phycisphaerae bacterium]|nr:glycosyltransferase family 4 protein [Phycisphaerae bacterium]